MRADRNHVSPLAGHWDSLSRGLCAAWGGRVGWLASWMDGQKRKVCLIDSDRL